MMTRFGGVRIGDGVLSSILGASLAAAACGGDAGSRESTAATFSTTVGNTLGTGTASTSGETVDPGTAGSTTSPTTTTAGTDTDDCACEPGEILACATPVAQEVCAADCMTVEEVSCGLGSACEKGSCSDAACMPGETRCGVAGVETCTADGEWGAEVVCDESTECYGGECLSLCEVITLSPTSEGCSFRANNMQTINAGTGALIVGNISDTVTAQVQLYFLENGGETPVGAAVALAPGSTHTFTLDAPKMGFASVLRSQGSYRVESNAPTIAYQHSPIGAQADNDASMLLPDHAAGDEFIISSYTPNILNQPSYFNVIALVDGTMVNWTPTNATPAGTGVPAVALGATGSVMMNAGDTLQVAALADLTGTRVTGSEPIWVVGAVTCVQVPTGITACDHIEEQQLPLEYWGDTYVAAHAPTRDLEEYRWRFFGGDDAVTITATPPQSGFPMTLNDGQWVEFAVTESFVATADGPFMPVQYLVGQSGGAGTGDPAMYQMVPVEQFLDRYAFVTGTGYMLHYAQITRVAGGADVFVDGTMVTGYTAVGTFEVADWPITEGSHLAESGDTFGIVSVGYTPVTSYAYPGGMRLEIINPG